MDQRLFATKTTFGRLISMTPEEIEARFASLEKRVQTLEARPQLLKKPTKPRYPSDHVGNSGLALCRCRVCGPKNDAWEARNGKWVPAHLKPKLP